MMLLRKYLKVKRPESECKYINLNLKFIDKSGFEFIWFARKIYIHSLMTKHYYKICLVPRMGKLTVGMDNL